MRYDAVGMFLGVVTQGGSWPERAIREADWSKERRWHQRFRAVCVGIDKSRMKCRLKILKLAQVLGVAH